MSPFLTDEVFARIASRLVLASTAVATNWPRYYTQDVDALQREIARLQGIIARLDDETETLKDAFLGASNRIKNLERRVTFQNDTLTTINEWLKAAPI